jgi:hypothetical protein
VTQFFKQYSAILTYIHRHIWNSVGYLCTLTYTDTEIDVVLNVPVLRSDCGRIALNSGISASVGIILISNVRRISLHYAFFCIYFYLELLPFIMSHMNVDHIVSLCWAQKTLSFINHKFCASNPQPSASHAQLFMSPGSLSTPIEGVQIILVLLSDPETSQSNVQNGHFSIYRYAVHCGTAPALHVPSILFGPLRTREFESR